MVPRAPEHKQKAEVVAPKLHPSCAAVAARQPAEVVVAVAAESLEAAAVAATLEVQAARYQKYLELWNP